MLVGQEGMGWEGHQSAELREPALVPCDGIIFGGAREHHSRLVAAMDE